MEFNPEFIPNASFEQLDIIEGLLRFSTISAENNEYWSDRLDSLTYSEAENLINYLQTKQVNRIHAGLNYNASYVNWFLKKTI